MRNTLRNTNENLLNTMSGFVLALEMLNQYSWQKWQRKRKTKTKKQNTENQTWLKWFGFKTQN